ncbi:DUF2461 domain-containing protein [Parapedobacter tibetensis]|uniref:DUF2461 domain-containing protein n=1 Tax=Parapedobacter tibetensis TaxID=2972951 RepID=UPI00214D5A40|nr:DUF2461 domain-containing protein [Parapedobacter tibetensis]
MISKATFQFLKDLKKNNNRDWFMDNKSRFEEAKADFEEYINSLISQISKYDKGISHLQAKDCIFRIYRDVRFSKDKSPYKTNFGAHITSAKSKSEIHTKAGYYIHLAVGDSMLAGGAYLPPAPWLKNIRAEIDYHGEELKKIITSAAFKKYFKEIEGEKLVKAPKGVPKDHPDIELLKYKSYLAVHKLDDKTVLSKEFVTYSADVFKALKPFDDFLNRSQD